MNKYLQHFFSVPLIRVHYMITYLLLAKDIKKEFEDTMDLLLAYNKCKLMCVNPSENTQPYDKKRLNVTLKVERF